MNAMIKPYLMQIETTTACNAKCKMCPRDVATRSTHSERMETEVFWETVRQAHEELGVQIVLPFIDGEPLADPRMVDFVEGCATRWPKLEIGWYTNGSLLTEEKAIRLLKAGNIHNLNVSMQGGDKATYESTMGLPWERTVANMEKLLEINRSMGNPVNVRANMCVFGPTAASVDKFREKWEPLGAMICLGAFSNFGGLGNDKLGEEPWRRAERHVCDRGTRHMYVFWNGDVGQCCFDLIGSIIYGNVKTTKLPDIWASETAVQSRQAHWDLRVKDMPPICRACNAPKFHG